MSNLTSRSSRWCFTINNPTNADTTTLQSLIDPNGVPTTESNIRYLIYSTETGASGTPHYQGFVIFHSTRRFHQVRTLLGGRAHVERTQGTSQQAADYCRKEGSTNIVEHGSFPGGAGRRTDLEAFHAWVKALDHRPSKRECYDEHPAIFLRYGRAAWDFVDTYQPSPQLVGEEEAPDRAWQESLWELVNGEPQDRSVVFVYDPQGNAGKSWFAKFVFSRLPEKTQLLRPGKRDDVAMLVDETKSIFIFDVPRAEMQFLQYAVMEQLKDGFVQSNKYRCAPKYLGPCHVIVMCNEPPDDTKLSADRYHVIQI